jgi:ATP-dependent Clp protease protease subunit
MRPHSNSASTGASRAGRGKVNIQVTSADDTIRSLLAVRMFDRRVVFAHGVLDDRAAGELAIALMTLDAEGDDPIELLIDCWDGTLDGALASIDTVDLLGVPVHATCVGRVEGPACGLLAVCDQRRATSNTRFRISAPHERFEGTTRDALAQLEELESRLGRFVARLADATGRPLRSVADDVAGSRLLDAEGALRYGLLDEVIDRPDAEIVPFRGRGLR